MNNVPAFMKVDSDLCEIKRVSLDDDHAFGDPPGDFETIASDVYCCLDRSMSVSKNYGGGREISLQGESDKATFKLFLLSAEDIQNGDRVIVGSVEYKVDDVIPYSTHKEAILTK